MAHLVRPRNRLTTQRETSAHRTSSRCVSDGVRQQQHATHDKLRGAQHACFLRCQPRQGLVVTSRPSRGPGPSLAYLSAHTVPSARESRHGFPRLDLEAANTPVLYSASSPTMNLAFSSSGTPWPWHLEHVIHMHQVVATAPSRQQGQDKRQRRRALARQPAASQHSHFLCLGPTQRGRNYVSDHVRGLSQSTEDTLISAPCLRLLLADVEKCRTNGMKSLFLYKIFGNPCIVLLSYVLL